jgi:pimeloyl-ACP methyl ester carboxylesterase
MPFAQVNGIRLHYQRSGRGRDVVMVHGLAASLAFWCLAVVPRLAGDFCVTAYDLRGHGKSDMPMSGYDQQTMCADLAALIDQLNIGQFDLVGHSFGGLIAIQYASAHPTRVRTLTLADVPLCTLQPSNRADDLQRWKALRKQLMDEGVEIPAQMPSVPYPLLEELAAPHLARARSSSFSKRLFLPFGLWNGSSKAADRWLQLIRTTKAPNEFNLAAEIILQRTCECSQPVLLIFGERSRWIESCNLLSKSLPDSRTVVVPEAGHFHPLQRPDLFANHLREFLLKESSV